MGSHDYSLSPFFLVEYSLHIHSHWWFTKWWYNPTLTLNTDLLDDDSLFHDLKICNVIFHRYSYDYVYLDSMMSKTWLAPNSMSVTAQPSSLLSSLSTTAPCFFRCVHPLYQCADQTSDQAMSRSRSLNLGSPGQILLCMLCESDFYHVVSVTKRCLDTLNIFYGLTQKFHLKDTLEAIITGLKV